MPSKSLRILFHALIDLDPAMRARSIEASDLSAEERLILEAMLAFDAVVAAPVDERGAVLKSLVLDEPVRRRLQGMLASDDSLAHLMPELAGEAIRSIEGACEQLDGIGAQLVGKRFGNFTLVSLIAEGGSSAVFRAERAVGNGVQVVALKVLRTGLFSREAQRRFDREQAILAQLDHPNIARLIEGGVSDAGIPYIAMELVDGQPITRAAEARGLGLRQRLQWFATLSRTIEAAHAALVVHRDIKPSNVLVTLDGRIKVLDFGIAKLLDDESHAATRTIVLTPEYAAPEQFEGKPVTAATDVYALGVVLGELLTGKRLPVHRRASDAIRGGMDATPKGLPSPQTLARLLEGDLDAILGMATTHEVRARYATAAALGDDVERHLDGQPVHAHPLTRRYRLRKFAIRHRVGVTIAALFAVATFAAFTAIAWQAERARQQAQRAEQEASRARTVRDLLVSVFNAGGADLPRDRRPSIEDIIEEATSRLTHDKSLPDAVRADLLVTLARVARSVGAYERSLTLLDLADPSIEAAYGQQSEQRREAVVLRAASELSRAHPSTAQALLHPIEQKLRRSSSSVGIEGLLVLGDAHIRQGHHDEGLAILQGAASLAADESLPAGIRLRALVERATALIDLQRFQMGLVDADAAVQAWHSMGSPPNQTIIELYSTIALAAEGTGDIPRAERAYREAIDLGNQFFDKPNPASAWTVGMYGSFLVAQGRFDDAEPYLQSGLEMRRSVFGAADPRTLNAIAAIGKSHAARREFAAAVTWYTQVVDLCAAQHVEDVVCSRSLAFRARSLARQEQFEAAEHDISAALEMQKARGGDRSPAYAFLLENKLAIEVTRHAWPETLETAEQILAIYANSEAGMIQSSLTVHYHHALALYELGRIEQALQEIDESEPKYARLFPNGTSRFDMLVLRARASAKAGHSEKARDAARDALALKAPPAGRNTKVLEELRKLAGEA